MISPGLSPLWISIGTSIAATLLAFAFGIAAAFWVNRIRHKGRGLIDGLLTLPLVLPPTVVGFVLLLLFGRQSALGQILESIGLRIAFSWPATVIAAAVVSFPLMYRAALGAFEQVNPNLLGAARTLGAGEWRTFRRVLLPLARPGILAGVVLTFARALGEFGATLMLAGNIPGKTQTLPVAIFFAAEGGDMRRALDWVIVVMILSLGTIAALNYWVPRQRAAPIRHRALERDVRPLAVTHAPETRRDSTLDIDITRRYPGFTLAAALSASDGPVGLLGASGSGKSLLLRSIAGLETPDAGRVVLNGRVLFDRAAGVDLAPAERRIGLVFQDYALFPHMTVRDNIAFSLHGQSPDEQRERVARWSRIAHIDSVLDEYPAALSGGQRQRVALARALAMEPEALLLDEPLSALDAHLRRQVEEQLRETLASYSGVTVFVTHDRDEAFRFCRSLTVLADGQVAASGPKHEVFANPRSLPVARLTGCKNFARISRLAGGRIRIDDWNLNIDPAHEIPAGAAFIGIRAHDVKVEASGPVPCWLVDSIESPFETTLYLRLHAAPNPGDSAHLEAEVSREEWSALAAAPQPWGLRLEPSRLLWLEP